MQLCSLKLRKRPWSDTNSGRYLSASSLDVGRYSNRWVRRERLVCSPWGML